MQPPKAMGSSLVKMLFHLCFLNKIIILKNLHTNWFTFSIGFGVSGGEGEGNLLLRCTPHVHLGKSTYMQYPHFSKNTLNPPPPPPRNEILDTPLDTGLGGGDGLLSLKVGGAANHKG